MNTPTATPLSDPELADLAVRVLDAALNSASVDVIGVSSWWDRAASALRTAASSGDSWQRIVSRLATKLQIDTIREVDAREFAAIGAALADLSDLGRWCYIAAHDTPYITAMCRITRADRKTKKETPK